MAAIRYAIVHAIVHYPYPYPYPQRPNFRAIYRQPSPGVSGLHRKRAAWREPAVSFPGPHDYESQAMVKNSGQRLGCGK